MVALYNLGLVFYRIAIHSLALFQPKARLWVEGRKNLLEQLPEKLNSNRKTIWMHCASLGEFEQGRPLLEQLRVRYPQHQIVLSFFSPSGFEIRKNYSGADVVTYLPLDSKTNAQRWIKILNPSVAIFVKYEFWYHYLHQLKVANCPAILISATFRSSQIFFQPYGSFFRKMLHDFQHLFVQSEADQHLLQQINVTSVSVCGDTRVDRVLEIAQQHKKIPLIENFAQGKKILILGSSWPEEEKLLATFLQEQPTFFQKWKVIIAPHDISTSHIVAIEKLMPGQTVRYSQGGAKDLAETNILLIDNIGLLSSLYFYGNLAFIGGGFGTGLHNILEPITFGLPVIFGPNFKKFIEARALVKSGGAFCIHNVAEFQQLLGTLEKEENYKNTAQRAKEYLHTNKGATTKIGDFLETLL